MNSEAKRNYIKYITTEKPSQMERKSFWIWMATFWPKDFKKEVKKRRIENLRKMLRCG